MSATSRSTSRTRATSSSRMPIACEATAVGAGARSRPRSDAAGQVVGPPAEELDAEAEGEPVGHPADVVDAAAAAASDPAVGHRRRRAPASGIRCGASAKWSTRPREQPDDLLGLPARGRAQVDALEVEGPERRPAPTPPARSCRRGRCGRSRRAPRARTRRSARSCGVPDDVAHLRGQVVGLEDPGPHGVLEVVADVRDAVGPGDHLALGRGGRRAAPRVVAHAVERLAAEVERRRA